MESGYSRQNSFFVGFISLTLSAAINGGVFFSFDKLYSLGNPAWTRQRREALSKKKDAMQFEFVEAPPQILPEKPKNAKRIAAFDALNQGRTAGDAELHKEVQGLRAEIVGLRQDAARERRGARRANAVALSDALVLARVGR